MKITAVCLVIVVLFVGIGNSLRSINFNNGLRQTIALGKQFQRELRPGHVGQRVLARWTNNLYYKGEVSAISKDMIYIQFDDGDKMSYQINDTSAVIPDRIPLNVKFKNHVIASWKGGKIYYIGFVIEVDQSLGYKVRFDDNDEDWYAKGDLRKFPFVSSPHALGSRVFARWSNGLYFRGFVTKVFSSAVFINYDDGDTTTLPINDPSAVIADNLPACNEIQPGQKVIGYQRAMKVYYLGTVSAISSEYFVQFDEGDTRWNAIYEIRIYPHALS